MEDFCYAGGLPVVLRELAEAGLLDGDTVTLDVPARSLTFDVTEDELDRRRASWKPPEPAYGSGYGWLYIQHVLQADRGADFDFLVGGRGSAVPRESH